MCKIDLSTKLSSLELKNPVITASGTCGFGEELNEYIDIEKLGALTVKGITVNPSLGNKQARIVETSSGILNSIGLENPGIDGFIKNKIPILSKYKLPVIVNISGHSIDDFAYLAEKLAVHHEISGIEVNVSCPNIAGGGMAFGTNSTLVYQVVKTVRKVYKKTIILKLSPNVTDIVEMALAAEEAGADVISLINTLLGMKIDIKKGKPELGNIFGGLSGPAVKPIALRMVYQVASEINIPIIGMGGIMTGTDAVEFLMAGASAVAIGTAAMINPESLLQISAYIKNYMKENNFRKLNEIIGRALLNR